VPSPTDPRSNEGRNHRRRRASTATWVLVGGLLAVPMVVPLLVPIYARETPELGGMPFFFWFQFALIPVAAIFTTLAFRVVVSGEGSPGEIEEQHQ